MIANSTPFASSTSFGNNTNVYGGNGFAASLTYFNDQVVQLPDPSVQNFIAYSIRTRQSYLENLRYIIDIDVVKQVIDIFNEKALIPSVNEELFTIKFSPENEDSFEPGYIETLNRYIEEFIERVDLYGFIARLSNPFLLYGEYPYRKSYVYKKGITKLHTDISVSELIGSYIDGEKKRFFLVKTGTQNIIEVSPDNYGHFIMNEVPYSMLTDSTTKSFESEKAIMGKSLFYHSIEQLKRLRNNQVVDLIDDLKKVLRPQFFTVTVPENMNPNDVTALTKKYERDFRSPAEMLGRDTNNININDLVYLAAQVKFIPQWTNKGAISEVAAFNNVDHTESNIKKQHELIKQIAVSVGLPPSYLLPEIDGQKPSSKKDMIHLYARFAKRVAIIQNAIEEEVRDLVCQDLFIRTGYRTKRSSIKVRFRNIIDSDTLDALEYLGGNLDVGDRLVTFVNNVSSAGFGININPEEMTKICNKLVSPIAMNQLFILQKDVDEMDVGEMPELPVDKTGVNPMANAGGVSADGLGFGGAPIGDPTQGGGPAPLI